MAIDRNRIVEEGGQKYANIFKRAYTDLNVQGVAPAQLVQAGRTYADAMLYSFLPEFQKQIGREPTDEEVREFLDSNINPGVAATFIEGTNLEGDNKRTTLSFTEIIKRKQDEEKLKQSQGDFEKQSIENVAKQKSLLEDLAKIQEGQFVDQSNKQFGQSRGRLLSELASAGRLNTPQASESLKRAESENQRTLQQALAAIRAQQIGSQLGVEQQGQQNIMKGRQFDVGTQQQNKQFGLQKQSLSEQIRQFNDGLYENRIQAEEQRRLAERLGRLQADANKPGILDYTNTAIGGLSALAGLGGALGKLNKGPEASYVD